MDSGRDWFGMIPNHWTMEKVRNVFNERVEKNDLGSTDYLSIVKDVGVIPYSEKGEVGNKTSNNPEKYKMVYEGDIVLNPMNVKIGSVGLSSHNGCLSNIYVVLKTNSEFYNEYYGLLFKLKPFQKSLRRISYGILEIRESINKVEFFNEDIPCPPIKEQRKIVEYISPILVKIDELLNVKRQKLKFIDEQIDSLIYQTITKGINPDVELVDSKIEWFGLVPKHWKKSKVLFELEFHNNRRVPLSTEEREQRQGDVPYYGSTGIIDYIDDYIFDGEYILTGEDGFNIVLRSQPLSRIVKGKFWVNNHSHIMKPISSNIEYLLHLLEITDYTKYRSGSRQPKLTIDNLKSVPLVIPPIQEQKETIDFLNSELNKMRKIHDMESKKIELIEEYRKSLISEVVTGKLKVTTDE